MHACVRIRLVSSLSPWQIKKEIQCVGLYRVESRRAYLVRTYIYIRSGNSSRCWNRNNLFGGLWIGLGFVLGLGLEFVLVL